MIIRNESISQRDKTALIELPIPFYFLLFEIGQIHVLKRIQYQNELDLIIKDVSDFAQIKSLTMTFKFCHTF